MLELIAYLADDDAGPVPSRVTGHPPIPNVLPELRRRVLGRTYRDYEPTTFYPRDAAWGAVLDLHKAGRHDDAGALAKLLLWCGQRGHEQAWETREHVELARSSTSRTN